MGKKKKIVESEGAKMKRFSRVVWLALGIAFVGVPAYAMEGTAGTGTAKPLSVIQFSDAVENHGSHFKLIQRKYDDYRSGRLPRPTLEASRLR